MRKCPAWIVVSAFLCLSLSACGTQGDTIKVGTISPNTGAMMVYGQSMTRAYKMAVDEINAAGGVLGKQLELVIKDDKMEPTETVNCFNSLVADGVELILGSVSSGCTAAITDKANEERVLLLSPASTADSITSADDYVFRICYADSFQGAVAAQYAKESGYNRVGVLYCAADTYSKGLYDAFARACLALDIDIVAARSVADITTSQDYTNQWADLAATGVEYVFAPFYYYTVGPYLVPQARQVGYSGVIMGGDGFDGANALQYQTGDLAAYNGVMFVNHYYEGDSSPEIQKFVTQYEQRYGFTPDAFTALAYDAVYVLADAISRAGTADAEAVRDALSAPNHQYKCITGDFTFDSTGTPNKGAVIVEYCHNPYLQSGKNQVETRLRTRVILETDNQSR